MSTFSWEIWFISKPNRITVASGAHLRVKLTSTPLNLHNQSPSLLVFNIQPSSSHCQIWTSHHLEITTQIISYNVELTEDEFLSQEIKKKSDSISRLLPSLELAPKVRKAAISKIISEAVDILKQDSSKIVGRKGYRWIMNMKMRIVTVYQEQENDDDDSVEELISSSAVVPARLSSIQELKKVRKGESCKERMCTICMEKFVKGSVMTWMSCCHVFHYQCLISWWSKSHYCPLCRFQMPRPPILIN